MTIPSLSDPPLCARCRCDIAVANALDAYPDIDRHAHSVAGIHLSPYLWDIFSLLYLSRRPLPKEEFEDFVFGRDISYHTMRNYIYMLRQKLRDSSFKIVNTGGIGNNRPVRYELRQSEAS